MPAVPGFLAPVPLASPAATAVSQGTLAPNPNSGTTLPVPPLVTGPGPFPPSPGLPPIPPHLSKQVQEGKYVDLGDFLPEGLSYAFDRLREGKEEKASGKRFPIKTPTEWSLAYGVYAAVAVHFAPQRAREMATYLVIIMRLARDRPGEAWLCYHRAFRQAAVMQPNLRWDRRDMDTWMSGDCAPSDTNTDIKQDGGKSDDKKEVESPSTLDPCLRFNRGDCRNQTCKFKHICLVCKSPRHGARACPCLPTGRRSSRESAEPPEAKRPR